MKARLITEGIKIRVKRQNVKVVYCQNSSNLDMRLRFLVGVISGGFSETLVDHILL